MTPEQIGDFEKEREKEDGTTEGIRSFDLGVLTKTQELILAELSDLRRDVKDVMRRLSESRKAIDPECVRVNHDYDGPGNLRITNKDGVGNENANIYAYTKSDWDNGLRTSTYCKGWSMTDGDGRWNWSIYLEAGTYYLAVDSPGFEQQSLKEVEVK